jgi:hypothetical protein
MAKKDLTKKPKATKGDIVYTGAKAVLSVIPLIGGPLKELFSAIVAPPLAKRQNEWIESIAEGLVELHNKVDSFDIDALSENESFITTVTYATIIALRNHKEMKIKALRNAVLNSAVGNAPDDDLQLMFLNFIDAFTPWHLRILMFYNDPKAWGEKNNINYPNWTLGGASSVLEHTFPELKGKREFYDQIVKDLHNRGLTTTSELHITTSRNGMFQSLTTNMGKDFLDFILIK